MNPPIPVIVAALVLFTGCAREIPPPVSPMDLLPEGEAGDVVRRAVEFAAGGWEGWESKRTVSYLKTTVAFDTSGTIQSRINQTHRYVLSPPLKVRIDWKADGHDYVLINKGDQAWKYVDGEHAEAQQDRDQAWNSTFGSHYVFSMPFKLTDPDAVLSYEGRRELSDGTLADAVRVDYESEAGSAGGMHTWTYFFDADDGRLVANHLHYGSGPSDYSFTEYTDYREIDGIHMPTRRYGYASNAAAERLDRLSEIVYEDVQFDVALAESLFLPAGVAR